MDHPEPTPETSKPQRTRAQGLVEFALILPVLLLVIFTIIELARLLHAWLAIENGARFGIRYAVTGEYDSVYCPGGVCADDAEEEAARIESIKAAARAGAVAILRNEAVPWNSPGYFKVTVCTVDKYQDPDPASTFDSADCLPADDPGGPGDLVSVTVDFNHPLIAPVLSGLWPELHLNSRREAIVEQFRTARVVALPGGVPTLPATVTATPTASPSPTGTATNTASPTPTQTPDCSKIHFTGMSAGDDWVQASVANDNTMAAYLTTTHFEWPQMSGIKHDTMDFAGSTYWGSGTDDYDSPTDYGGTWVQLGGGDEQTWENDFDNEPADGIWGDFTIRLTFAFPSWPTTCTITRHINITAAPTDTPTRTNTAGPSPTRTRTFTPVNTRTPTRTNTAGPSPTRTKTRTPTPSRTATKTFTTGPTPTRTLTRTSTATATATTAGGGGGPGD
jgi:Flp pilus assembly protein TadG